MKFNPRNWDPTPIEILAKEMMQVKLHVEHKLDSKFISNYRILDNLALLCSSAPSRRSQLETMIKQQCSNVSCQVVYLVDFRLRNQLK